jgi:hypothetical protein
MLLSVSAGRRKKRRTHGAARLTKPATVAKGSAHVHETLPRTNNSRVQRHWESGDFLSRFLTRTTTPADPIPDDTAVIVQNQTARQQRRRFTGKSLTSSDIGHSTPGLKHSSPNLLVPAGSHRSAFIALSRVLAHAKKPKTQGRNPFGNVADCQFLGLKPDFSASSPKHHSPDALLTARPKSTAQARQNSRPGRRLTTASPFSGILYHAANTPGTRPTYRRQPNNYNSPTPPGKSKRQTNPHALKV